MIAVVVAVLVFAALAAAGAFALYLRKPTDGRRSRWFVPAVVSAVVAAIVAAIVVARHTSASRAPIVIIDRRTGAQLYPPP